MTAQDVFGTAELRRAVLESWDSSPTRFREDANAEEDLRLGGYRDRLLVELAQNAADAAGADGVLRVRFEDGELRLANTGAPLTSDGVAALGSLRASAKREGATVGRFGVGFAAVLAVSDAPRVVSTSGAVEFSAERTRAEAAALPGPAKELESRDGGVPVLRLAWPSQERPPEGFSTEVRLPVRSDVDGDALLAEFAERAPDLLLALPALREVHVGSRSWRREDQGSSRAVVHGPQRSDRWLLHRVSGELGESALEGLGSEAKRGASWWACWAVPLGPDDVPIPLAEDVLHAPTPTEERLSLPARLLAGLPVEADRRRVAASPAVDSVLTFAAESYPDLVAKIAPEHRTALVPLPGFPLSDVDGKLRQDVLDRLRISAWLPGGAGGSVAPSSAAVLEHYSPELVSLLADVVPGLLAAELSDARQRRALSTLEVRRLGAAELVAAVGGLERPPSWWHRLYEALAPIQRTDLRAREEFAALPVPLADGRTVTGARDVLLTDGDADSGPAAVLSTLDISGLRIAHPDAAHPLLEQLGAHRAGPAELLDAPPLAEAVRGSVAEARVGADVLPLTESVLGLVRDSRPHDWLAALAMPDRDGEIRRADELLLPDAALLAVLDPDEVGPDGSLGVLDGAFAARWPRDLLRSVGVLDSFALHVEDDPIDPDEQFADSVRWWHEQERLAGGAWPPARFTSVRDLDLVADDAWPRAIRLLTDSPDIAHVLGDPHSHPAWWLARFAVLDGREPRSWRLPEAEDIAGIYDPVPDLGLSSRRLRLAGVRGELRVDDPDDAADLVARLGDPDRGIRAGTALRAHRVLADAVVDGVVSPGFAGPPESVRSLSGAVVSAERAVVLDEPWMLGVLEAPLVVAGGGPDQFDAEALAELLDLPLASEESTMRVLSDGRVQRWAEVGRVPSSCELLGIAVPGGEVALHDGLRVSTRDGERRVHWWVDATGAVHAERTPDGLARALAWAAGAWDSRFALAALLADPEAVTLLR
ncbi:sacsin N-terminal ATP-binding-like domain-containing protein [Saccharopolyspora sp. 6V]|uniref:sacsin N-terminal ATP-binding-like domain-containing protein n=1 Tax=Saccharopolyspora sp. 6V TaxID=2877239 RepID=UPI001CD3B63B|nr:ATP-binding protein [Saccharopolyspora sp. 6V]MCA1193568.1 ATP-binding protein [Saccharopolyspora sp. 6V]